MVVRTFRRFLAISCLVASVAAPAFANGDLNEIKARGVLTHLGVPYANFVTGSGDGLDVEVIRLFARHLGVRYEYVETDWKRAFGDLTGVQVKSGSDDIDRAPRVPIRGDLIANGLTKLPWRQKIVDYSDPTFPTGVWLIARGENARRPIAASGSMARDVETTKAMLKGSSVLVMESTCLDPKLYALDNKGLDLRYYRRSTNLNEMVPAILNRDAEMTLLDVPDALIALEKWPGEIKVLGPISDNQEMGVGFRKSSPELRNAFNQFLAQIRRDGTYSVLVRKYYPSVMRYFPGFFASSVQADSGVRHEASAMPK
jgi:ABC-type amino acid transport substrate-binding protein